MAIELEVNTQAVTAEMEKRIKMALYAIGNVALEKSVESISGDFDPSMLAVDTGRLRASLSFVTPYPIIRGGSPYVSMASRHGDQITEPCEPMTTVIGTNVEYAEFVHNGTSKMRPRPFLLEGIMQSRDRIEELLNDILKGADYELSDNMDAINGGSGV